MPTIDIAKLLPWILGALAIAAVGGWFVTHDRAVAREAVAEDRAKANEKIIELQDIAIAEQEKVNKYADELAAERLAERNEAQQRAGVYGAALEKLSKDPDVARVLGTLLPQSLRELRRHDGAADGGRDRVPVLRPNGLAQTDAGAAPAGRNGGPAGGGSAPVPRSAEIVQPGQGQARPADQKPERPAGTGLRWLNPLNWFEPSPRTAP